MTNSNSQTFAQSEQLDAKLIESAQKGDKQALALIYKNYSRAVYALLYRMVWNKETAQELMQDTFIDVITKLSSYRADANLYAWIRKVAVNNCLMYFRKNKKVLLELSDESKLVNCDLRQNEKQDHQIDVQFLLKRLSPKRRLLVWLHEVEGLTHKEIAELLGKSISYSKTELSRALKQLHKITLEEQARSSLDNQTPSVDKEVAYAIPCQ